MQRTELRVSDSPSPSTNTSTLAEHRAYKAGRFDHQRRDAYKVAKEALGRGDRLARRFPRAITLARPNIPRRSVPPGIDAKGNGGLR